MAEERDIAIQIEGLRKRYRLGTIGGGTLKGDIESWWARKRGKEDPNSKIGAKTYTKNEIFYALDGIDLTIYKGERIGIIGHNGAGKSTLLKLLSRVTAPTEGKICIDGRIASMLEVGTGFNGELTGRENVYLNGAILGMTKAEVDAKIEQIIDFSEVRQFIDTPVKRYSSGMYVKLAFSVAAHLDSEIMIMDEVLAVGDMAFQKKCLAKMREVSEADGRTVLYVSHNMNTIRQLCERCIVLDHGKVIFNGSVQEAISLYLGGLGEYKPFYDYNNVERDGYITSEIIIHSSELINESNYLKYGENLKIRISYESKADIDNLFLRINFYTHDGKAFATAMTPKMKASNGMNYIKTFEIITSYFAPAKYYAKIVAFEPDYKGNQIRHESINNALYFEIDNSINVFHMQWLEFWWGNYTLPEIRVIE